MDRHSGSQGEAESSMSSKAKEATSNQIFSNPFQLVPGINDALAYWVDAWQRSILLLDVLRQRGNNYIEHSARQAPHVLTFEVELVLDGRTLPQPVNYGLVRVVPPQGTIIDQRK